MKIKAEKWIIDDNIVYKLLEIEKCCDDLMNSDYITLNNKCDIEEDYNEDNYFVKLYKKEYYGDDFSEAHYDTINFCPYCGKPIIIAIINTVNKTEEYKILNSQRDDMWKKCCNTDSKKKEQELSEKVRELDKQINEMLVSDDFERVT